MTRRAGGTVAESIGAQALLDPAPPRPWSARRVRLAWEVEGGARPDGARPWV